MKQFPHYINVFNADISKVEGNLNDVIQDIVSNVMGYGFQYEYTIEVNEKFALKLDYTIEAGEIIKEREKAEEEERRNNAGLNSTYNQGR